MHQRPWLTGTNWRAHARRLAVCVTLGAAVLAVTAPPLAAHEIPTQVLVRGFVVQDSARLRLYLRVPLESMRDVDFPLRNDGSLDLVRARALLNDAVETWLLSGISITADGQPLRTPAIAGVRLALPSDRAFATLATARASFLHAPIDSEIVQWQRVLLDVMLEYQLPRADARLELHPDLAQLGIRTTTVLHIVKPDGRDRLLTYDGNPESVSLDPAWYQTGARFLRDGVAHILSGIDHLLFLCCLVLPVLRWRSLIPIVTAFTLAHSITLAASALGFAPTALWFPPLVEVLIAVSIVWLCLENILLPAERLEKRWPVAFGFGLVHGFGFAFALSAQLQFAGDNLLAALAAFNAGVELGQLGALAAAVPVLWAVRRYVGADRVRLVTIVGSVLVAHTAWHWCGERGSALLAYRGDVAWPVLDASFALGLLRAMLLAAIALAVALALRQILRVPRRS